MQLDTIENISVAEQLQNTFATHTRTHAEHLAKDYDIKNPQKVGDFIGENLFLMEILEEIPYQIRRYFGVEQKIILLFFLDPEDPTAHCLHVRVPTTSGIEARQSLEKFGADWWNENEINCDFKIFVNLDFV